MDSWKFLFASQIIAYVKVKYLRVPIIGTFHQNRNGDTRHYVENIFSFAFWIRFFFRSDVSAQIEDINLGKFFFKAISHAAVGVFVNPIRICNESDNAFRANPVARPAKCLDIAVVKWFFRCGSSFFRVGLRNAIFKARIVIILGVIISRALSHWIWRVAHDYFYFSLLLLVDALRIFLQRKWKRLNLILLIHLKRVSQANAVEREV